MVRKLLFFSCLPTFLFAGAPTIPSGQHTANKCTSCGTVTCTLTNNISPGDDLWVFAGTDDTTRETINTPTMTGETFFHPTGTASCSANTGGGSGHGQMQCFHLTGGVCASCNQKAVTVTITGTTDLHCAAVEVSGQQQSSTADAAGNAENASPNVTGVSTSAGTINAKDLVLAYFYDNNQGTPATTLSAGSGYGLLDQTNNGANTDVGGSESNTVSTTGIQKATMSGTNTFNTDLCEMGVVAIAPANGGSNCIQPFCGVIGGNQ